MSAVSVNVTTLVAFAMPPPISIVAELRLSVLSARITVPLVTKTPPPLSAVLLVIVEPVTVVLPW